MIFISMSVFVALTGCMGVRNVAMDSVPPETSTIEIPPVRLVFFPDDPEGGKDAYLQWFISVLPVRTPEEIRRIWSYKNVDPTLCPRWLIEFEFDRFLDMAAYLNRPEIAEIMEDLPNHVNGEGTRAYSSKPHQKISPVVLEFDLHKRRMKT